MGFGGVESMYLRRGVCVCEIYTGVFIVIVVVVAAGSHGGFDGPTSARLSPLATVPILLMAPWTRGCVYVSSASLGCRSCCVVRRTGACVCRCFLSLLNPCQ